MIMGIRIDNVESDIKNANFNIQDARNEMRTIRSAWNAITIATLLGTITLFIWLDGKSDDKFTNLMAEIRASNSEVNTQMRAVNAEVKNVAIELVKINHSIATIDKDHEKFKPK